jgi:preprotein translocase SecE subunit
VSKKEDDQMTDREDDANLLPEPPPGRVSSSDVPAGASAAPRAARFGEGKEGRAVRRERGVEGPREGFFGRAATFVHDVRAELKRVSWPTALEVRNTTIITIIAVVFFAFYLWAIDKGFTFLIGQIERLIS